MLVRSSPTAVALLIMFWMGQNLFREGICAQTEMMKRQAEFNMQQTQFNSQQTQYNERILKAIDELSKVLVDIHADVNAKKEK